MTKSVVLHRKSAPHGGLHTTKTTKDSMDNIREVLCKPGGWLGLQPKEHVTYAGKVHFVWENQGGLHNSLVGVWPLAEEVQLYHLGTSRGYKGRSTIFEAFRCHPSLFRDFKTEFNRCTELAKSEQPKKDRTKRSI
eukprot:15361865-Ditylum_brightwellii.AAC.2